MRINEKMDVGAEKRGRGRPRKSVDDSALAKEKTKKLAREVRAALAGRSGKVKVGALLSELSKTGFGGGESLWRRYEAGIDAMSPNRMFEVAAFAYARGARGEAVRGALLSPRHDHKNALYAEEAALINMSEAIKTYLWAVDPFETFPDDFGKQFDKMVNLAREMAWQEYQRGNDERMLNQEKALEESDFFDDPDAFEKRMIEEHEKEEKEYFFVSSSPTGGGALRAVPKPAWLASAKH